VVKISVRQEQNADQNTEQRYFNQPPTHASNRIKRSSCVEEPYGFMRLVVVTIFSTSAHSGKQVSSSPNWQ